MKRESDVTDGEAEGDGCGCSGGGELVAHSTFSKAVILKPVAD